MKNLLTGTGVFIFFLFMFYIAIGEEMIYFKTTEYSKYTIEIELLNGSIDTIIVEEPSTIHFQVNCHSHKGEFNGCDLEAVPSKDDLLLGGHWYDIRDGVINFKILKKEVLSK